MRCTSSNGSYSCQADRGHAQMHYAYFISAGMPYVALWSDKFSRVITRKAPAPTRA